MTEELQQRVYILRSQGVSQSKIATQLGIGRRTVYQSLQVTGDPYQPPDPLCIIEWCQRQRHSSLGYCVAHLYRYENGIPVDHPFKVLTKQPDTCTAPGCDKKAYTLGYCKTHAAQHRKHKQVKPIRSILDTLTYHGAHHRCGALWGAAKYHPCCRCGKPAADWAYDGTDPTELYHDTGIEDAVRSILPYSRFPEFYMPMCKVCHKQRDLQELDDDLVAFREWRKSQRSGSDFGEEDNPPF